MLKQKSFGIGLIIYSFIAWVASGTLVLERLELFKDAGHVASCDFGLFVSCTGVMKTPEAALFGFPNPFLGIVGFAITGTIGVLLLILSKHQEVVLPTWFRWGLQLGVTFALALICFFWYTSVISIMILCPWCMVVWSMIIPMVTHTTAWNMANGLFGAGMRKAGEKALEWAWLIVLLGYVFVAGSILLKFQEYIF